MRTSQNLYRASLSTLIPILGMVAALASPGNNTYDGVYNGFYSGQTCCSGEPCSLPPTAMTFLVDGGQVFWFAWVGTVDENGHFDATANACDEDQHFAGSIAQSGHAIGTITGVGSECCPTGINLTWYADREGASPTPTATATATPTVTATPTATATPNVFVQMQRAARGNVFSNSNGGIDEPLEPTADLGILVSQPLISGGVVADGVTPLLFKFVQRTAASASYTVTIDNPSLAAHLHVWQDGHWTGQNTVTFDGIIPVRFAYIEGLAPEAVIPDGQTEINAALTLTNTRPPNDMVTTNFLVRRPPIFLVHGYNSDSGSWGGDFMNALAAATPRDFIRPVSYGVVPNGFNTWGSFGALVPELDSVLSDEEASLHQDWAVTRYDVVAHSQGGILTRLLCGQSRTNLTRRFKGPTNFNRGRFRRVITIGSPHNGSTMAYYVSRLDLLNAQGLYGVLPAAIKLSGLLQPKFFPFEVPPYPNQTHAINQAVVHPEAKFRVIAATINGGDVPPLPWPVTPAVYSSIGLNVRSVHSPPTPCAPPLLTRGEIVLGCGSDGIVDIQSQRGGTGTPLTQIGGVDIAHLMLPGGPVANFLFFGTSSSETSDDQIASIIAILLTGGTGYFGPFHNPDDLTSARKAEIDAEIPSINIFDLIFPFPPFRSASPLAGTISYTFMFTPDPSEPLDGPANWYAEVFGPNGVTTAGLAVTPDPSDSTHVTVDVDQSVQGEVALYLSYNSTTGHLVFGRPVVVVSIPPGANLTGVEVHPTHITATIGDVIGLEIWGLYDNGSTSQLFVQPENATFSSSNPNVASVDSGIGLLTAVEPGNATVTATYSGLTNNATIHVNPPPRPIRIPRQRPSPPQPRPTPIPHITPFPPPPSPRPTPVPRP